MRPLFGNIRRNTIELRGDLCLRVISWSTRSAINPGEVHIGLLPAGTLTTMSDAFFFWAGMYSDCDAWNRLELIDPRL